MSCVKVLRYSVQTFTACNLDVACKSVPAIYTPGLWEFWLHTRIPSMIPTNITMHQPPSR